MRVLESVLRERLIDLTNNTIKTWGIFYRQVFDVFLFLKCLLVCLAFVILLVPTFIILSFIGFRIYWSIFVHIYSFIILDIFCTVNYFYSYLTV